MYRITIDRALFAMLIASGAASVAHAHVMPDGVHPPALVVMQATTEGGHHHPGHPAGHHDGLHAGHGAVAESAAGSVSFGSITIEGAFARPSFGQAPNSAAYMTLRTSGEADRLIGAASPAARTVELHAHTTDDSGVMRMRRVDGIPLEIDSPAELSPGGYHVMLIDLTGPLEAGTTIPLTLSFERAGEVTLDVPVARSGVPAEPGRGGHSH